MFAQLYYNQGSTPANIMADISSVLTGASALAGLSANLVQENSVLDAAVPGTWEFVADSTNVTDVSPISSTVYTGGNKILRQPCASDPATFKYMKVALFKAGTTYAVILANIGKSQTSGTLVDYAGRTVGAYCRTHRNCVDATDVKSGIAMNANGTIASTLKVTVFSDASITALAFTVDTFFDYCSFAVIDFQNNWADAVGILPSVVYGTQFKKTENELIGTNPMFALCKFTYGGQVYSINGTNGVNDTHDTIASLRASAAGIACNDNFRYRIPASVYKYLLSHADYKFSDFKNTGTQYPLMPFGFNFVTGELNRTTGTTTMYDALNFTVPFCPLNSNGCYLTNAFSFGKNGITYKTALGTLAKFGHLMVKVGE